MAYKVPKTETEIRALAELREAEGPFLEYKSSRLFEAKNDKIFEILSKELTAFANAAGGVLIIGVEEDEERCIRSFNPISDSNKTDSWLEDGLLPRISPPMAMTVHEIEFSEGTLMVIDVPSSPSAPHQASDKRYYARRLFRVDPLLSYEIDDIRRRAEGSPLNVSIGIWFDSRLINFYIKNSGINPIYNVSVKIDEITSEEISQHWSPGLNRPYLEPFRIIHEEEKMSFLGVSFDFFKQKGLDEINVTSSFVDGLGISYQKTKKFYINDYDSAKIQRTNAERSLEKVEDHLAGIKKALLELSQATKSMSESAIHPSGINLSKTSLSALSGNSDWKWSGENLSHMALAEVLEVDMDTAAKIWSDLFGQYHLIGGSSTDLENLDVAEDVKEKIRQRLVTKGCA